MQPPDYTNDARRIPRALRRDFVKLIREARGEAGYSMHQLGHAVREIVAAHNAIYRESRIELIVPSTDRPLAKLVKYELEAIGKHTPKYIAPYLAWLCRGFPEKARAFYEQAGLAFRPCDPALLGSSTAGEVKASPASGASQEPRAPTPTLAWRDIFKVYGRYENLAVVPVPQQPLSLIELAGREPLASRVLRLREAFCFRLNLGFAGHALGFQRYKNRWYPLVLTDTTLYDRYEPGQHTIPRDGQGRSAPLSEDSEAGTYGFAIMVAADRRLVALAKEFILGEPLPAASAAVAARILAGLEAGRRAIYRINVRFEP